MVMPGRDRLSCDEVLRRLDDYVDRALTPAELRLVEEHVGDCLACASVTRFETTIIARMRERLRRIAAPPGLLEGVRDRLRADPAGG